MIDFSKPIRTTATALDIPKRTPAKVVGVCDDGRIRIQFDGQDPGHKDISPGSLWLNFENYEPEQPVGDCTGHGPPCNPGPLGDYAAHGEPGTHKVTGKPTKMVMDSTPRDGESAYRSLFEKKQQPDDVPPGMWVSPEIAADVAKSIEESAYGRATPLEKLTAGDGLAYEVGEPLQFDASKLTVKVDGETIKLGPDGKLTADQTKVDTAQADPFMAISVLYPGCSKPGPVAFRVSEVIAIEHPPETATNAKCFVRLKGQEWAYQCVEEFETVAKRWTEAKSHDERHDYLARHREWLKNEIERASKRRKWIIPKEPPCDVRTAEPDWPNKVWIDLPVGMTVAGTPQMGSFRADEIVGIIDDYSNVNQCRIQLQHHDVRVELSKQDVLAKLLAAAQAQRTYPTPLTDYEPKPATTPEAFK